MTSNGLFCSLSLYPSRASFNRQPYIPLRSLFVTFIWIWNKYSYNFLIYKGCVGTKMSSVLPANSGKVREKKGTRQSQSTRKASWRQQKGKCFSCQRAQIWKLCYMSVRRLFFQSPDTSLLLVVASDGCYCYWWLVDKNSRNQSRSFHSVQEKNSLCQTKDECQPIAALLQYLSCRCHCTFSLSLSS